MSREIKLRVWDKSQKRMLYSYEPQDDDQGKREYYPFAFLVGFSHWNKEDLSEPMQFTGLYDRNKKPIYEGDIVATGLTPDHVKSTVRIGEWTTSVETREYSIEKPYYGVYLEGSINLEEELIRGEMCVVGNIYETPTQGVPHATV